jgi:hypothetical protein
MIRKSMMVIGTVLALGFGMAAVTDSAEASHKPRISLYFGSGYYGGYRPFYRVGYRYRHCHVYKIKRYGKWRKIRECHRRRHY